MITLTLDKHAMLKADFFMKDSDHQGPRRSTPQHEAHPGGFTTPRKVIENNTSLHGAMVQNCSHQKALYPRLLATVRRPV
jgi:hypothetical protein